MAIGDTPITLVGNMVADPELRFTPAGVAVANFRVASTPRIFNKDTSQYEDGEALFLTCNVWRQGAENVAESLTKGMRVIVNGRLKQRTFQTKEGENRTVFEIDVDEVGPSLTFASVQVNRNPREGGQQQQPQQPQQQQGQVQPGQGGYDPRQGGFGGQQQQQQGNNWGNQAQGGGFTPNSEQPPY